MTYIVNFTETNNPNKAPITVVDQILNKQTSIALPGKKYYDYPPVIGENFLHLLENFARSTPPGSAAGEGSPVQGQLWYDNSNNVLKVYDGSNWRESGSVKSSSSEPSNNILGDLWVNTVTKQLYLWSGTAWIMVGPQTSGAVSKTGLEIDVLQDDSVPVPLSHDVVKIYSQNNLIAIISKDQFTPKIALSGFTKIYQGITLSTVDKANASAPTKFWGVASEADALRIKNTAIPATNFVRTDQSNTLTASLLINSEGGISIKDFNIRAPSSESKIQFLSSGPGKSFEFTVRSFDNNKSSSVLYVDAAERVGINTVSPTASLDIIGNTKISDTLRVNSIHDTNSIVTAGGITIGKQVLIGGDTSLSGTIKFNRSTEGAVIEPSQNINSEKYDIGSNTKKFRNVYARTFYGDLNGSFTGDIVGNVTGSAGKLATSTAFTISGDVISSGFAFNGESGGTATFNSTLSPTAIASRTPSTTIESTDELLLNRVGAGLIKQTRSDFVAAIGAVPIGGIVPYLGVITTDNTVPPRFKLCDGRILSKNTFPELFLVIGYTYDVGLTGSINFKIPDLRNQFSESTINYIVYTGVLA